MVRNHDFTADRDAGSPDHFISASKMDTELDDIAAELSNSIAKDGQTTPTANLPMGSFKLTGLAAGSARTDSIRLGQVQDGVTNWVEAGGTADAITATYAPAITALVDGQICRVRAAAANTTTTPTFSPNGLTARTIVKEGGNALQAGDIRGAGHELVLVYDAVNAHWDLLTFRHATGLGGFAASDYARLSASNTFTADQVISEPTPAIGFSDSDGAANEKNVFFLGSSGQFIIQMFNDAYSANSVPFRISRSGHTATHSEFETGDLRMVESPTTLATNSVGFRGCPVVSGNSAYTLVLSDAGKTIYHDETTARTWTIPANSAVAFPIGTTIVLDNTGNAGGTPGTLTLSITSDTLRRGDGVAGTGSRTISANQVAVIRKTKSTEWVITGSFS